MVTKHVVTKHVVTKHVVTKHVVTKHVVTDVHRPRPAAAPVPPST
jgi:hypothetical protein